MSLRVHGFICGWLTAPADTMIDGAEGERTIPVPSYLLEHEKGLALFDTGLPALAQTDPAAAYGRRMAKLFKPTFSPGEEVSARIEALGHDPARVDLLINSHLHFDHCGGNHLVPNASLLVQRREWEAAKDPELARKSGFDGRLFDLGHKLKLIDGEYDVFGDGSAVLLPTFGHTAGHQSLHLRTENGETILTADCCYFHSVLDDERLPSFAHDKHEQLQSLRRLKAMRGAGTRLICGHDVGDWTHANKGVMAID